MTDQYLPPAPDQHDTAAYARQAPPAATGYGAGYGQGQAGYGPGHPGTPAGPGGQAWYVPGQATPVGNPEAEYWAARYRSQRTWTRVMAGMVALAALVVVGVGFAAVQAVRTNPLVSAAEQLSDSLGQSPEQVLPEPAEGTDQAPAPDGQLDEGEGTPDSSAIPLPESLQGLGNALGITDVRQLLDLAVANGLISQEDADKVRAALEAGQMIQGLTGDPGTSTQS